MMAITKGDKVKILRTQFEKHREFVGQVGIVTQVNKREKVAYIKTELGTFGSFWANVEKVT